jgi:hypothetical protein
VTSLRRRLLFAVLVYVALDLCLPSMPGAFVFDAGSCVESVRPGRTLDAAGLVTVRAPAPEPHLFSTADVAAPCTVALAPSLSRVPRRSGAGLRTATPDPAPPSEDSH